MTFHEFVWGLLIDFVDSLSPFAAMAWRDEPPSIWDVPIRLAHAYLEAYDSFDSFRADWKWQRLLTPLQGRLIIEQILWDRGLPWRSLITGFRAIEGDAGETGVSGPALPPEEQTPPTPYAPPPQPISGPPGPGGPGPVPVIYRRKRRRIEY